MTGILEAVESAKLPFNWVILSTCGIEVIHESFSKKTI